MLWIDEVSGNSTLGQHAEKASVSRGAGSRANQRILSLACPPPPTCGWLFCTSKMPTELIIIEGFWKLEKECFPEANWLPSGAQARRRAIWNIAFSPRLISVQSKIHPTGEVRQREWVLQGKVLIKCCFLREGYQSAEDNRKKRLNLASRI